MNIQKIPVIEHADFSINNFQVKQFIGALKEFGHIHIINITDPAFCAGAVHLKRVAQQLFGLSHENKMSLYIGDSIGHRGYVPITEKGQYADENKRVYEAFDIGFTGESNWILSGENRYPEQIPDAAKVINRYFDFSLALGRSITSHLLSHYDHHGIRAIDATRSPASQLRLIHYLSHEPEETQLASSMGAHTDYELFTLMLQDSPGLFYKKNGDWQAVPAMRNSLLLIAGDVLEILSGGEIQSLNHRVVANGDERYSFPFFMNLNPDTQLKRVGAPDFNIGRHLISQLTRDFPYLRHKVDATYNPDFEANKNEAV
ncbi:2OG-Fe(II) oxygenase family protein [Serratia ficaria]|uniref:2-oxoglutarate-dependent ethylene/succinate-forming enzyme n=1 Tax=Serratia ficaria TaxID=61651 RepID=A0A240CG99_SERFI|nr:2OG-Fe(II) oxygenase family protein [Serratia ficaria]MEE4483529.1 2OG-Fe(II) oxygenase family protein [Serratia ficaria]REF42548.1 isopenicillin N synthase-like dioxygenase [Serratia ficaria]CAI1079200.1 2-oxoglutarate-dependent ethylene/succinate-forming enzyme [Serratia ficaria]CAI1080186.1 2-oxoglutarate-dependent ethylene/succinate-forming enzyme [Serratia ficaria]CAI1082710.1 2-oxoglutarate-dependent ethylene/succinate-forming enzyme [Serratia ficaria]